MPEVSNLKAGVVDGVLEILFVLDDFVGVRDLQVTLLQIDEITTDFFAAFPCSLTGESWMASMPWKSSDQLRVFDLRLSDPETGEAVEFPERVLLLEQEEPGEWKLGEEARVVADQVERDRDERFNIPLQTPGADSQSPKFSVVMLADNIYLTQQQYVPGIWVIPIQNHTLGSDVVGVLNDILQQRGFGNGIHPDRWMETMRQRRPSVVIFMSTVFAESGRAAHEFSREQGLRLLDLLALRRGASPQLLGGAVGQHDALGTPVNPGFWIEGSGYTGNLIGGMISGEDLHGLQLQWGSVGTDPRVQLWLSLYSDALGESRWDYRLFRCFNLLEAIGTEIVPRNLRLVDANGHPRLQDNRQPYTTKQARGKVYQLLDTLAQQTNQAITNFSSRDMNGQPFDPWEEVGVWTRVRNAIAHRGSWAVPAGQQLDAGDQQAEQSIIDRSNNQSFEDGAHNLARSTRTATESVLFALLHNRL